MSQNISRSKRRQADDSEEGPAAIFAGLKLQDANQKKWKLEHPALKAAMRGVPILQSLFLFVEIIMKSRSMSFPHATALLSNPWYSEAPPSPFYFFQGRPLPLLD
jgi:hypothetical protein